MRKWLTTLADLAGTALVAAGLLGYDWRISAIVTGSVVLVVSKLNT